ncbi:MAG: hypothetical protein FWH15_02430 [Betaproteobacteria bacterium]|nr:hypothetical protein [Betaproteobacteria bacterium]
MKFFMIAVLMLFASIGSEAYSEGSKCSALSVEMSASWERHVPCYCGDELSNLEVTLPQGLRVDAVCGLSDLRDSSHRWVDLHKEKASLDYYDEHGYLPNGVIYLSGQITLTGSVSMEPSDSGDLLFSTNCDMPQEPAFLRKFCEFKLDDDSNYKKLGGEPPSYDKEMKCWTVDATLRFIDLLNRQLRFDFSRHAPYGPKWQI